jgi:hypothetical protein
VNAFARLVLIIVLAAASAHFGYYHLAQEKGDQRENTRLAWLSAELDLTPAQRVQVQALHEMWSPHLEQLRRDLESERQAAGSTGNTAACLAVEDECKACTVTFVRQMAALLSDAQRQKYLALVAACLPMAERNRAVNSPNQGTPGERPAGR